MHACISGPRALRWPQGVCDPLHGQRAVRVPRVDRGSRVRRREPPRGHEERPRHLPDL